MSGKVLRISSQDLRKLPDTGGLGLTCLDSMKKSLRMSQLLRLLKNGDEKTVQHIAYWIGEILEDLVPDLSSEEYSRNLPNYFLSLADLVAENIVAETVSSINWNSITNKMIYLQYVKNFPPTKVELDHGGNFREVWRKLYCSGLPINEREILFLLIHNKLPIQERLFRCGLSRDPYCEFCLDEKGAVVCDIQHFFCSCLKVMDTWKEIKTIVTARISSDDATISYLDILSLRFSKCNWDPELVWLLGSYVHKVWHNNSVTLNKNKFFGFLKFKFKKDQMGSRLKMKRFCSEFGF